MKDFLAICEQAARVGAVLTGLFGRAKVREKGPRDLVTEADLASQESGPPDHCRRFPPITISSAKRVMPGKGTGGSKRSTAGSLTRSTEQRILPTESRTLRLAGPGKPRDPARGGCL